VGTSEPPCSVAHDTRGISVEHLTVEHLDDHIFTAIDARCLNTHRLAGEQPAHGQRFQSSLAVPLLLAFHGDAVMSGLAVEWCKGGNEVGAGLGPRR